MDPLTRPSLLTDGARVRVVAPAGPVPVAALDRGMAWLRGLGWEVVEGASLRATRGHGVGFLAGQDGSRHDDLVAGLLDPETRAVLAARGGTGTPRLLDDLPWGRLARLEPTIVVGSSDLTALHQAVARRLGWASLWAPMPAGPCLAGPDPDPWSRRGVVEALDTGPHPDLVLTGSTWRAGPVVSAPLVGGTIAVLSALQGTDTSLAGRGAIVVLEDVGERPYRLQRFLTHLRRTGFLDGAVGFALGQFVDCRPVEDTRSVLLDALGGRAVPVVADLTFGHGDRQASLWLGRSATLDPDRGTLTQRRPA